MKYAAVCLHFDSMAEFFGFPNNFRDPAYLKAADRFFQISKKYKFKYSIYVIGKDLEKKENRELVKIWSDKGHEIGNHSWSHLNNLGAKDPTCIRYQIQSAHEIILETTGRYPRGFVAPGWCVSPELIRTLISLGYSYDASAFPSWIMYPALLKLLYNQLGSRKFFEILNRKDFGLFLYGPKSVYHSSGSLFKASTLGSKKITMLPMPVNKFRMGCWHTLAFSLGWKKYDKLLNSCIRENDTFYYVVHPADLLDKNDIDLEQSVKLERLNVPLSEKINYLESAIQLIIKSGRKIVKMEELAAMCN